MTKELLWLTLTIILTGVMWVPYMIDRAMVRGFWACMDNPSRSDKPQSPWAQRLYFAHTNAVENLIIFAPLVLILDAQGHSTRSTIISRSLGFTPCASKTALINPITAGYMSSVPANIFITFKVLAES